MAISRWILVVLSLIKGTAFKLSDKNKSDIMRMLEEDELRITDKYGNEILTIPIPKLSDEHKDIVKRVIEDKYVTFRELGELLDIII
jgi:hypothetical protein